MNKNDYRRLQNTLLGKIGVTGGWIDKIDSDGVYLYLTWGAVKKLQSSDEDRYSITNWCEEGKHWGAPTNLTNPDGTLVVHCAWCGKELHTSEQSAKVET